MQYACSDEQFIACDDAIWVIQRYFSRSAIALRLPAVSQLFAYKALILYFFIIKSKLIVCFSSQDTVVCMSDRDPANCQNIYINTDHQGEDITYMLTTYTLEDTQRWRKALCQHIYSMSEAWMNSLGFFACLFFKFFELYKHWQSNPCHYLLAEHLTLSLHRMRLDLQGRRHREVLSVRFLLQRNYEYVYTRTGCAQN